MMVSVRRISDDKEDGMNIYQKLAFALHFKGVSEKSREKSEKYASMTADELRNLTDNELFDAVYTRLCAIIDTANDITEGVGKLNPYQKALFISDYFDSEVNTGGLGLFFGNSNRFFAPLVSESLDKIGAAEHKGLFDRFVADNGIDLSAFSSSATSDKGAFEDVWEKLPFSDFNLAYYRLQPLCGFFVKYAREHVEEM